MSFKSKPTATMSVDTNVDSRIVELKSKLDDAEIKLAVTLYNKIRYAVHDAGVFISADSQTLLNKTYWIVALETRLNSRPDLNF